ncbi:3-hydroxyacyl-CoA dehydrogenase [Isorropodon fossajaponicum endosymbiont JTNG4]|uniref:3-hydroxyacyl-CoA dehydrogenase/enoyl-CoA hydratase family protein n=1 Tax=Isorropodon fossajaponicum symbiont TaxID=883811 RepID=UPI0019164F6D|nr:3-hydroxyacyl-CoA dehydrogenase/enoyl-CoA hydratase family protein [Isorropodon fossajaponicum symbiont]BBB24021.1 3-hydroxyacyl-CoA dehydrogenase [Isorropodon fossajaponicum endosymbiont JTNG4]
MKINQVGILGSGVMGVQIAGVFANANIPTLLFGHQDHVKQDLDSIIHFKPEALTHPQQQSWITPVSFEDDLKQLLACDLVIEVIVESLDAKQALLKKIMPYLSSQVILASNTSSLSINQIGENLGKLQSRFCGIHFFNPPRYMPLIELVPSAQTDKKILDTLEEFFTSELGKNILHAKDTSGFIANRIGVFSIAACLYHAQRLSLSFDTVDALTGKRLKRPKSATFRTADLVGLDILKHVFEQFYHAHPNDPWRHYFKTPTWLGTMVENHLLGVKTKAGFYKKEQGVIKTYQIESQTYLEADYDIDASVEAILKKDTSQQIALLKNNAHPQAQFLYSIIKDTCFYSAYHIQNIACSVRDIDWALRWGFGWTLGIFEFWHSNNVKQSLALFLEDDEHVINPDWLNNVAHFYTDKGAYSPIEKSYITYSNHSVYHHQLYRPTLMDERIKPQGQTIFENDSARFFHDNDGIGIFSLKTKLHTLNLEAINSLKQAIKIAEQDFKAIILWQDSAPFCAGANLYEIIAGAKLGMIENQNLLTQAKKKVWQLLKPNLPNIENLKPTNEVIELLQQTLMALKYSKVPSIAVIEGLVLGGGCEMMMHCDKRVAYVESYIGLVEAGVGLLPAGGGCKEMARRAAKHKDIFQKLAQYFEQIGLAKVSTSAKQAVDMGYLDEGDLIISQRLELLYVAKQQAQLMIKQHYRQENPNQNFKIGGATAKANLLAQLVNMRTGEFISEHDELIAQKIADTLCGGELESETKVDSQYLLNLEKKHFIELLKEDKTQDRIEHMLVKHKPLRN